LPPNGDDQKALCGGKKDKETAATRQERVKMRMEEVIRETRKKTKKREKGRKGENKIRKGSKDDGCKKQKFFSDEHKRGRGGRTRGETSLKPLPAMRKQRKGKKERRIKTKWKNSITTWIVAKDWERRVVGGYLNRGKAGLKT